MSDISTPTLLAIVTIVATLIGILTAYGIKYLRQRINTDQYVHLQRVAENVVAAIEQQWRAGKIQDSDRFRQAALYIQSVFPKVTQADIVEAIEAAVLLINNEITPKSKPATQTVAATKITLVPPTPPAPESATKSTEAAVPHTRPTGRPNKSQ